MTIGLGLRSIAGASLLLAGCVAADLRPDDASPARIATLRLVAMEVPAFELNEGMLARDRARPGYIPPPPVGSVPMQGFLALLALLAQLPSSPQAPGTGANEARERLGALPEWYATQDVAWGAARALGEAGRAITVAEEIRRLPAAQATVLRDETRERVLAWYDRGSAREDYAKDAQRGADAVIEIGFGTYTAFDGRLFLQVYVRMTDPRTGRLMGRTRAAHAYAEMPPLPPMEQLFAEEGCLFRKMVVEAGTDLALRCLREMALLPAPGKP